MWRSSPSFQSEESRDDRLVQRHCRPGLAAVRKYQLHGPVVKLPGSLMPSGPDPPPGLAVARKLSVERRKSTRERR